ncbi:MFS transporter [Siculibacillus lacustris]|uniref:MFS transporter n=1 Tax=Siculibacillus lacustris TaxID=1549641 RepID=A0A4Q9VJE2_9HYPH|nr:MFS transporter [Siculibacillus lacustris]TBW34953.1 MFS transporter [Siculibacillus lacustris]
MTASGNTPPVSSSASRVLFASLIGTTIEFFDFYIYATAAVIVFPKLFFPGSDPASAVLQSFATFSIAFFARPIGAAIFGHFGDRIGRKATLVAALMTMGLSTIAIGVLPTYATVGVVAPLLLALCRLGQGLGLGGEWGGAVLLATENAPAGKRAWYGMFPQLGAPIGFILSNGSFLALSALLSDAEFFAWGWRLPFIASSILVFVGLWVRLRLTETPDFLAAVAKRERVRVPIAGVFAEHKLLLLWGTVGAIATFVLFYIMTVFALNWGTTALHYTKSTFLPLQLIGVCFFGLMIPVSALVADRFGYARTLIGTTVAMIAFGFALGPIFGSGSTLGVLAFLILGFSLMGFTYGPLGTALAEPFPVAVRYTGASLAFNLAGIFGASLAPYFATTLALGWGLQAVGWYLAAASALTLVALLMLERGHDPVIGDAVPEAAE